MRIPLDHFSSVPIYRQIEKHLRDQILSGSLLPNTRLPATRKLAQVLGVSRITVKNAYAELESNGLTYSREGSGTYVLEPIQLSRATDEITQIIWPMWQQSFANTKNDLQGLEESHLTGAITHEAPIDFTGVGDPNQFSIKDFMHSLKRVIKRDGTKAFVYDDLDGGYPPLRETISHVLASQGIQVQPDNILITSGSQQGLSLVCQILLNPDDVVLVEKPTYNYALELFRTLKFRIIGLPVDEKGMRVDMLEPLLQQQHPKLIYTIPNFQNPTGMCLSSSRRRKLIALAERYNIPILEDDFAGDLRFEGRAKPAIKALDPGGGVIYIGTFSKMLMPGLRIGFLAAEGPILKHLVHFKCVNDLITSTLMQRALNSYVSVGRYQTHLRRTCRLYRRRRDAMISAIRQYLPQDVIFYPPQGGLFIWLRLPPSVSALDLLPHARKEGVFYTPGSRFFPEPYDGENYIRLNFATQSSEAIDTGIKRLGKALALLMDQNFNYISTFVITRS